MSTKFNMTRDISGTNGFGLIPTDQKVGVLLATGVAQSTTVPSGYPRFAAIFSYTPGANVFVDNITTAAAFTGTIGAVTAELNPSCRLYQPGETISLFTPDAAGSYVGIEWYVAQDYIN